MPIYFKTILMSCVNIVRWNKNFCTRYFPSLHTRAIFPPRTPLWSVPANCTTARNLSVINQTICKSRFCHDYERLPSVFRASSVNPVRNLAKRGREWCRSQGPEMDVPRVGGFLQNPIFDASCFIYSTFCPL